MMVTLEQILAVDVSGKPLYVGKMYQATIRFLKKNGGRGFVAEHVLKDFGIEVIDSTTW